MDLYSVGARVQDAKTSNNVVGEVSAQQDRENAIFQRTTGGTSHVHSVRELQRQPKGSPPCVQSTPKQVQQCAIYSHASAWLPRFGVPPVGLLRSLLGSRHGDSWVNSGRGGGVGFAISARSPSVAGSGKRSSVGLCAGHVLLAIGQFKVLTA